MDSPTRSLTGQDAEQTIRLLQQELADTNAEVLALTLELDKRLEDLRAAEQRFRRLAENAPDIILRYDLRPRPVLTFINPPVSDLTGYSAEEFYADPDLAYRVIHPEDRAVMDALFRGEGPPRKIATLRWIHRNGTVLWMEQHHYFVRDADQRIVALECIARDVTDRKRLQEELLQAQKMEAIGRLAGGIAHDFNNLLTIINGYSAQAMNTLPKHQPLHQDLQEVYKAGERAAALTRQLLAFSRRQVLSPQVLDINAIVLDMRRMLGRVLGEDIALETLLEPQLGPVQADPGQLEQVIMNLAVNARDAMPSGGRLLIETGNVTLDASPGNQPTFRPGRYAMLAITDTGCGMDPATRARIFEPFFTTKPVGQGTGLGLSTVFGIVQQSGGDIAVHSEPGKGTTFQVFLPIVSAKPASTSDREAAALPGGEETILVAEDEEPVLSLIQSVLAAGGYTVLAAHSSGKALLLAEHHPGPIHLLVTDVVMPEMSGPELAEEVTKHRPEIRVLFMSGYTDNPVVQRAAGDPKAPFLQKPFSPNALFEKIREILGGTQRVRPTSP